MAVSRPYRDQIMENQQLTSWWWFDGLTDQITKEAISDYLAEKGLGVPRVVEINYVDDTCKQATVEIVGLSPEREYTRNYD